MTRGGCECGYMHPPLAPGQKCPMIKEKDNEGKEINTGTFVTQMSNILTATIQRKGIKDQKKFFGQMIVGFTKMADTYEE